MKIGYEVLIRYNDQIKKYINQKILIKFKVDSRTKRLNLDLIIKYARDFNIYLISPSNKKTKKISPKVSIIKDTIKDNKINAYLNSNLSDLKKILVNIELSSVGFISEGEWKLVFIPIDSSYTEIDISATKLKYKDLSMRQAENSLEGLIPAINIIYGPGFYEEFKKLNTSYKFYKMADNYGTIFVDKLNIKEIERILSLDSVESSERWTRVALLGEINQGISQGVVATEDIGANFIKNNPNISISGKGVIIGIVDSGIDYLHKDFIYPDGTSKILYIWDQTKDGRPPKGYSIGTEYSREEINEAIKNNDPTLTTDEDGQGTMLSGICAGLGNINKEYTGIAEDSELIIVKMKKVNGYYNNASSYIGTQYIYEKSKQLKRATVLNISVGSTDLVGRSSRVIKEKLYFSQGFIVSSSAGNEGNTQTHTSGKINLQGEKNYIDIEVAQDEDELSIQLLCNKPDKISVGIITPSGEQSKTLQVTNFNNVTGIFDLEGATYSITYLYPTTYSGQQETIVNIKNVKKGTWRLMLIGEYIISGIYHAYLPNRVFLEPGTKFTKPDPQYTINYPGNYYDQITVGAYDTKNGSLWSTSSRGPTIDNFLKPEIVAPGVDIIAPYPGNRYATITGTAVACAHVSGALALFLQYVLVDNVYPDKAFIQLIRPYLEMGANRKVNVDYPNYNYGYGILDIRGMFDQLK